MEHSIGLIELTSIAKGYEVADALLKAARVQMVFNRSICPGKFMVMVAGETAAVRSSIRPRQQGASPQSIRRLSRPRALSSASPSARPFVHGAPA